MMFFVFLYIQILPFQDILWPEVEISRFNTSVPSFFLPPLCLCRSHRRSISSSARHQPSRFWKLRDQSLQSQCLNRGPLDASGVVSSWSAGQWPRYAWQPAVQLTVCLKAEKHLISHQHLRKVYLCVYSPCYTDIHISHINTTHKL